MNWKKEKENLSFTHFIKLNTNNILLTDQVPPKVKNDFNGKQVYVMYFDVFFNFEIFSFSLSLTKILWC